MRTKFVRIKLIVVVVFGLIAAVVLSVDSRHVVQPVGAFSAGPPVGHTGAPQEDTCAACHSDTTAGAQFTIIPPTTYIPGQTYQVIVRHTNADPSRQRWGFQLTALAGGSMAGTFGNLSSFTQTAEGAFGRIYIHHTSEGTFEGQTGGAQWTFNWIAPATAAGPVTFYAAGNQANGNNNASGDRIVLTTAASQPAAPAVNEAPFDFDGDGKTDIGIFRPAVAEWWIRRSSTSQVFAAQFGAQNDVITPGDFTNDGKTDIAFWRPSSGSWFILRSEDFSFFAFPFGTSGDIPVPGDFDGDNETDAAVYRPSQATWFIRRSTGGTGILQFGASGDQPVPSDYDGDGKADIAIYRPSLGQWWIQRSSAGTIAVTFGTSTDRTVPGDYTGDGKSDIAFWRPSNGQWFVLRSEDLSFFSVPFGVSTDIPAAGDFDGDGKWDTAIFRPGETNWYINRSTQGIQIFQFGASGDRPIPNSFVR